MAKEGKEKRVMLTKPLSIEAEENQSDYSAPNLLQRILSLFAHVRPGSDLSRFQLPAVLNLPKSQLQCYGESIYSTGMDLLGRCNGGNSSLERFINVVAWTISTTRPCVFGSAPYNSLLGETHHVSRSSLNVLLEQQWHPDRWTRAPTLLSEAKQKFQQIQEAYLVLSDHKKRTVYDAGLYDPEDEEDEGFSEFVEEMVSLMAQVRREEKDYYTMEELQSMFTEMVHNLFQTQKETHFGFISNFSFQN